MKYEKQLRAFLDECLKDATNSLDHESKHHYFDMAFGGASLVMSHLIPEEEWESYNKIYEEYWDKFTERGCL